MANPAPQVIPASAIPSPEPAAPEPVTNELSDAEKEKKLKEAEDVKEKELKETEARKKAAKDVNPEPVTGITRTFTTHVGQTVTVAELPNAARHEDAPATVPEADHTVVKKEDSVEQVAPVNDSATPVSPPTEPVVLVTKKAELPTAIAEGDHTVIKKQDIPDSTVRDKQLPVTDRLAPAASLPAAEATRAATKSRSATVTEHTRSIDGELAAAPVTTKAASTKTVTIDSDPDLDPASSSIPLSAIDRDIGIFPQYFANMDTTLDVQVVFRTDGVTSQAFTDNRGTPMFTLDRKPSLLQDKELRDKSHMFILGIHKRRFRRPKQWFVKTGSDHGIRVKSSWKHRNKSLTLSFTNQPDGHAMKMLLEGRRLHLGSDVLSPVVAVIEPTRLRVAKGLDLTVACVAYAVKNETQEAKSGGSLRSMRSLTGRWGK